MKNVPLQKKLTGLLSRFSWICGFIVCSLVASIQTQAQTVEFTQNRSGNHTMAFDVPLANYPGRGLSLPVSLHYSTHSLWRVGFLNSIQLSGNVRRSVAEAVYAEYSTAGWTTSIDIPKIEWPRQNDLFWYNGTAYAQGTVSGKTFRIAKLILHMPDGSSHELRKADAVYADNGTIDKSGTFYAVDASRLRYDSNGQNSGTLYLPDGTRYVFSGSITQCIDSNGNTLTFNADTRQWNDTMARAITMPWPVNPGVGDYTYSLPGVDIPYTFKFRALSTVLSPDAQSLLPMGDNFLYFPDDPPSGANFPQSVGGQALFKSGYSDDSEPPSPSSFTYVVGRGQRDPSVFNPTVLAEIVMPNGQSYRFSYNNYGELDRVFYPTGAYQRYEYSSVPTVGIFSTPYVQGSRGMISRWLSPNGTGGTDEAQWTYSKSTSPMTVTAPDGSRTEVYLFFPTSFFTNNFGYDDSRNGLPYEERVYAPASQGGAMLRRTITDYAETTATNNKPKVQGVSNPGTYTAHRNPRPVRMVNLVLDTGGNALAKTATYEYAANGFEFKSGLDPTASTETHFLPVDSATAQTQPITAIGAGTTATRIETTYLNTSAYQSRNILGIPTSTVVKGLVGGILQTVTRSETFYDEAAYPLQTYSDLVGDPGYIDPNLNTRGNPTTIRRYLNLSASVAAGLECPAGVCLQTHAQFDQTGNLVSSKNERGIQSQMEYAAINKHAYPTKTITAVPDPTGQHGANTAFSTMTTFDSTTGLPLTATDVNGQVTSFSYKDDAGNKDPLNRLRKTTRPDGGWTKYSFGEAVGNLFTLMETQQNAGQTVRSYQYSDPVGRMSRTFISEGGNDYMAMDKLYDQMGRVSMVSNLYRTTVLSGDANLSHTGNWTSSHYDALGRLESVTLPDGATVQTDYEGVYTTVTDAAGKLRRQKSDALGRLIRIDEPDASGSLGPIDSPTQPTYYQYDPSGNLVAISQGMVQAGLDPEAPNSYLQHRYFKFDALNRLIYERQLEQAATLTTAADPLTGNSQWSKKLVYDETFDNVNYSGLLTSASDARSVQTQFRYDNLSRIYQVNYSDGTPTVTNNYDQVRNPYLNKGRLTEALTATSGPIPATAQVYNFDLMGRVINHQQTVAAQTYTLNYGYDLGGNLTSESYPSGRVINYALDDGGRLLQVASGAKIYADQFDYKSPTGSLKSLRLGNGAVETHTYNSRVQLETLDLTRNGTQLQHYDYKYGVYDPASNTVDEAKNNGQIAQIESSVSNQKQWQQRFAYDGLNRLTSTREFRGDNNQQSYLVNYDYDVFGNRYQKQSRNGGNPFSQVWVETGQIDQNTNRFNTGVTYDNDGNLTVDARFRNLQYKYDANNRQKQSSNLDLSGAVDSIYDASGQRVATQVSGSLANVLVYDIAGKLVAEYNGTPANNGTQYVFADHLGTPRTITNNQGTPVSRHDYLPYGEELGAVGTRASIPGYGGVDDVRQKYAGMESDEATGMGHTLWRKYDSYSARWTSPDPYGGSMATTDPQSFNRYTYVNNDPVNQNDPTGLMGMLPDASTSWSDVAEGFWGTSFGGPRREDHIGEAMARHDSILETGVDPAFPEDAPVGGLGSALATEAAKAPSDPAPLQPDPFTPELLSPPGKVEVQILSLTPIGTPTTVSNAGANFIAQWEAWVPHLYNDAVGHCTIGFGHLVHLGNCGAADRAAYPNGINRQQGMTLFRQDLSRYENLVSNNVKVPLTQNQFDALVSFSFNIGPGRVKPRSGFLGSSALSQLNKGNYNNVAARMARWNTANGRVLRGLTRRRAAEGRLFNTP